MSAVGRQSGRRAVAARAGAGRLPGWVIALVALVVGACAEGGAPANAAAGADGGLRPGSPARAGRFGSLRDLVLFPRSGMPAAAAIFCDRFEVTRGDWAEFAAAAAGRACRADLVPADGEASVAVALVDLAQARAFAHWRFLRLPRRDEWETVALDGGRRAFPWGSRVDPSRANTAELGLWQAIPVGAFESGRQAGSNNPYDLIGNVSEWTESPAASWWDARQSAVGGQPLDPLGGSSRVRAEITATPALAAWTGPAGLAPAGWLLAAGGTHVPRDCVGSDFASPMEAKLDHALPDERSSRRGVRLLSTAGELLAALCAEPAPPAPDDVLQLRRFLARDAHRDALAAAWRELAAGGAPPATATPLGRLLAAELGIAATGQPR